jgi:hypothetical protein
MKRDNESKHSSQPNHNKKPVLFTKCVHTGMRIQNAKIQRTRVEIVRCGTVYTFPILFIFVGDIRILIWWVVVKETWRHSSARKEETN